MPEIDTSL